MIKGLESFPRSVLIFLLAVRARYILVALGGVCLSVAALVIESQPSTRRVKVVVGVEYMLTVPLHPPDNLFTLYRDIRVRFPPVILDYLHDR